MVHNQSSKVLTINNFYPSQLLCKAVNSPMFFCQYVFRQHNKVVAHQVHSISDTVAICLSTLNVVMEKLYDFYHIQNNQIRQFLLSSLIRTNTGRYHWKFNLSVIEESLHLSADFPHINNPYNGRTLFIGGGESKYIR